MPVIRVKPTVRVILPEQRQALIEQLTKELEGAPTATGPIVFELPLEQTDKMDVLVVWEAWKDVPSEIRSDIILSAYKESKNKISQPLGVTYREALDQHLLPYAVVPMTRGDEVDRKILRASMLKYGGIPLEGDKVDLRYPTLGMAEQAHRNLCDELPKGYWSIVSSFNPMY